MTELLRELEAVVGRMEAIKAANWDVDTAELSATRIAVIDFVHDHHAEIAKSVRDARRYRAAIQLHKDEFPDEPLNGELTLWAELDAHNSAREVGE